MAFDRSNPAHLAALKSEATTDPVAVGYTVITDGNTSKFITEINAKNYTVQKPKIAPASVISAVTFAAYNGVSIDGQEWLQWITSSMSADETLPVTADIKQQLAGIPTATAAIWAAANRTAMNAAMAALINVPGSRAEVLWGYGTSISREDWLAAEIS